MNRLFLSRLVLDLLAISLLLTAFAYDLFGNAAHEIIGTCMFALLISHNVFNRRWYGTLTRDWREPRSIFSKAITLCLLLTMLGLFVTSIIISQTVFDVLAIRSSFTIRQLHALAAYVVLFVAALHVGLQWSTIMRVVRHALGVTTSTKLQALALRGLALVIACYGVHSLFVIDIRSKLLMQTTFSFWDFEAAAIEFIMRHLAIVALCVTVAHYSLKLLNAFKNPRRVSR